MYFKIVPVIFPALSTMACTVYHERFNAEIFCGFCGLSYVHKAFFL